MVGMFRYTLFLAVCVVVNCTSIINCLSERKAGAGCAVVVVTVIDDVNLRVIFNEQWEGVRCGSVAVMIGGDN